MLSGTHPHLSDKSPLRFLPSSPRCKLCQAPFGRPGALLLRRYGYAPWPKNPRLCGRCFREIQKHSSMCPATAEGDVRGAEVELSMLFADIRGSSQLARQMSALDFTRRGHDSIKRGGYRDFDTRAPAIMSRAMPTKRSIVGVVSAERQVIPVSKSGAVPPRFL